MEEHHTSNERWNGVICIQRTLKQRHNIHPTNNWSVRHMHIMNNGRASCAPSEQWKKRHIHPMNNGRASNAPSEQWKSVICTQWTMEECHMHPVNNGRASMHPVNNGKSVMYTQWTMEERHMHPMNNGRASYAPSEQWGGRQAGWMGGGIGVVVRMGWEISYGEGVQSNG